MQNRLQWHPGAYAAFRIEFWKGVGRVLVFENEYNLGTKPRQIDFLVIKKDPEIPIEKNIGRIFRRHNIVEYKSPADYLSINDFYRVYAYACFYLSDTEEEGVISPDELTITFICTHFPRKLLRHLAEKRGMSAQYQEPGIYYLTGDPIPMQLIVIKGLSAEENLWLSSLRTDIRADSDEFRALVQEYEEHRNSPLYESAMDLIIRANWQEFTEGDAVMCGAIQELFKKEFEEYDQKIQAMVGELKKKDAALQSKDAMLQSQETELQSKDAEIFKLKKLLEQFTVL